MSPMGVLIKREGETTWTFTPLGPPFNLPRNIITDIVIVENNTVSVFIL